MAATTSVATDTLNDAGSTGLTPYKNAESSRATGVGFSGDATDFDAQGSHTGKLT